MKLVKQIIIFLGTFMLYHIVFSSFFPVDENNVLQAPEWYTYLGLGIATIAAIAFTRKNKSKKTDNKRSNPDSLINYLRGTSTDVPLDNIAHSSVAPVAPVTPVEIKLDNPQINSDWNLDTDLMAIDQMEGHDFEYWCAELLRKIGFHNVEVTQGSGDQGVDVLAEKDGICYAVQCKCYSKDLGNKPVQEVHAGKDFYHCHIGVVMTNQHFTAGAKQLAEATGTLLWDRDWIKSCLLQRCITAENAKKAVQQIETEIFNASVPVHDELLPAAVDVILKTGQASVSMLQRHLKLGYARCARIMDEMEEMGIVGPFQGSAPP